MPPCATLAMLSADMGLFSCLSIDERLTKPFPSNGSTGVNSLELPLPGPIMDGILHPGPRPPLLCDWQMVLDSALFYYEVSSVRTLQYWQIELVNLTTLFSLERPIKGDHTEISKATDRDRQH